MKETKNKKLGTRLAHVALVILFLALPALSQAQGLLSQKVTIQAKNANVTAVLGKIHKQTGINFFYSSDLQKKWPKVSIDERDAAAKEVLEKVMKQTNCVYEVKKDMIIIKQRQATGKKKAFGRVFFDDDRTVVMNAQVRSLSTRKVTVTDSEGRFSLDEIPAGDMLQISYIGMKTIQVKASQDMTVYLQTDSKLLSETVVVGYGEKARREVTSSISSMDKDLMDKTSATAVSLENLMAGSMKGVLVNTSSGEPGATMKLNIRGITSPYPNMTSGNDNNSPLFVIDGVPMFMEGNSIDPLVNIAPDDVESIDVLKDAAATAIFGSRGANGVVIINTKRGHRKDKVTIDAGYTFSVGNPLKNYDVLNTDEFISLQNTILKNTVSAVNNYLSYADYSLGLMNQYGIVTMDYDENWMPVMKYGGEDRSLYGTANTDWTKEVQNNNAATHQYNFSARGGSSNTDYSVSFNGLNQEGMMINDKLERYTGRLTVNTQATKFLSLGSTLSYSYAKRKSGSQESFMGNVNGTWQTRPDVPVLDQNGDFTLIDASAAYGGGDGMYFYEASPVSQLANRKAEYVSNQILGNAYVEVKPIKGLKLRGDFNFSRYMFKNNYFVPSSTQMVMAMPDYGFEQKTDSYLNTYNTTATNTSVNFRAEYGIGFDENYFNIMAGYGADRYWSDSESFMYQGFSNDQVLNNQGAASTVLSHTDGYMRSGLNSFYGRISYSYADRYLAEADFRADESSKFAPDNRWAYFPALSVGWRINKEKFLSNVKAVNDLKLRMSIGRTGSTNVADFAYRQFFTSNSKYGGQSATTLQNMLPNTGIKWEKTTEYNVGLDFSFFDNRLTGGIDLYHRYTDGALAPAPYILESGMTSYYANVIDMTNRGIELSLGGDIIRSNTFTWHSNMNLSRNRNKIKHLNGANINIYMQDAYIEGYPAGVTKGYIVKKIAQSQEELDDLNASSPIGMYQSDTGVGDFIMEDLDGNGYIDTNDRKVIANPEPDWFGGWFNSLTYKGFNLSFQIQYQWGGNALYSNLQYDMAGTLGNSVLRELYDNMWTEEHTNAKYPRLVYDPYNTYNLVNSDRYVFSTNYLRLKNITLSYAIPSILTRKAGINYALVFVSATNLFTITPWPGLDPESTGGYVSSMATNSDLYPLSRTFSMGLKLQF